MKRKDGGIGHPRIEYQHRWLTEDELAPIYVAYKNLTGRSVFGHVKTMLVLAVRRHGPDTVPRMEALFARYGVQDLLKRLLECPAQVDEPTSSSANTEERPERIAPLGAEELVEMLRDAGLGPIKADPDEPSSVLSGRAPHVASGGSPGSGSMADPTSPTNPDDGVLTRAHEQARRVAEMRPQNDQGAHPRERKARVGRVPADSGDRSPREDQREIDDLWEGWLHPLPGSVVEAVDTKPRRPNRPGRP
jgi:hypothetical protein